MAAEGGGVMAWKLNSEGDACVSCDHPWCTAEIVHWMEKDDHAAASDSAMAAGWRVSIEVDGRRLLPLAPHGGRSTVTRANELRALLVEVEELRDTARSHNDCAKALYAEARKLGVCESHAWALLANAGERLASVNDLAVDLTVKLNEALR